MKHDFLENIAALLSSLEDHDKLHLRWPSPAGVGGHTDYKQLWL